MRRQKVMLRLAVALCLALSALPAGAQTAKAGSEDPCRAAFSRYWKADEADMTNVHLTIRSFPRQEKVGKKPVSSEVEVRIAADKDKVFYETETLALYRDKKHTITVLHPRRMVMLDQSRPAAAPAEAALENSITSLRQEFIKTCKLQKCYQQTLNGETVDVYEAVPQQVNAGTKILKSTYYCSPKKKQIIRQVLEYSQESPVKRQEIVVHSQKHSGRVPGSAWGRVFTQSGKLNTAFAGYNLQDNR